MRILLVIFFALGLAYFFLDRQLFFYGKNDFKIYDPLPVDVKPQYWGYDLGNIGFVLVDDFDFVVAGKGTKYKSSEVIVDEIAKYGFDREEIVVVVNDSIGSEHVLILKKGDGSDIDVSVDNKKALTNFTWIEVKGKGTYIKRIELIRNYVQIAFVILFFVLGFLIIKKRMKKSPPGEVEA